jgi:hypothetical protein
MRALRPDIGVAASGAFQPMVAFEEGLANDVEWPHPRTSGRASETFWDHEVPSSNPGPPATLLLSCYSTQIELENASKPFKPVTPA